MSEQQTTGGHTRRGLLLALGGAAAAGTAGWVLRGSAGAANVDEPGPARTASASPAPLADADQRPGITFPAVPQRHALVEVLAFDRPDPRDLLTRVRAALAGLPDLPADAGIVTVTFGFAPQHARVLWPERSAAASDLPSFVSDADGMLSGGDLAVQVCGETVAGVRETAFAVRGALGEPDVRWRQAGTRDAPTEDGTARTAAGFIDGIINPRTAEELAAGVWSDRTRRDTHLVLRRMRISADFGRLPVAAQERAVGRHRDTGAPLSGGGSRDQVDLLGKRADGELLTPLDAHARRANPVNIGRGLMLRRSYSIDGDEGAGLLFAAFLSDPSTFTLTQRRLDERDALMVHTRTDASGCFFVPGEL
ncbi:Dyp-type peroxidase [Microbacterium sp. 22195]|uniref:Dyp-type peroxidase n=1 Tax=Microbacterium sp. 22195 TaxID=3453891 RepID=UPI003F8454D5